MAFKFVVFAAFVAVARAGVLAPAPLAYAAAPAPLAYAAAPAIAKVVDSEYDPNPQYSYSYDVQDGLTGDSKSQSESRSGDVVQGQYSLNDADGTRRTVDYTADPVNGFNAVVRKEPLAVAAPAVVTKTIAAAPVVAKAVAPVVHAAPALAYSAPIAHSYSAPIAHSYSAPIAHAPLAYSAPIAHAPLAYSAPIAHAPLAYSASIAHAPLSYSAPIAKFASPLVQSAPLLRSAGYSPAVVHTSFSSPYATYAL